MSFLKAGTKVGFLSLLLLLCTGEIGHPAQARMYLKDDSLGIPDLETELKSLNPLNSCDSVPPPEVIVSESVLERWKALYLANQLEFVLCLKGKNLGSKIIIEDFEQAVICRQTEASVSYLICQVQDYLGTLHNHPPPPRCWRSEVDVRSFVNDGSAVIDVVLCGPENYVVYDRKGKMSGPGADVDTRDKLIAREREVAREWNRKLAEFKPEEALALTQIIVTPEQPGCK